MLNNNIYILMIEELLAAIEGLILLSIIGKKIILKIIKKNKNQKSLFYLLGGYLAVIGTQVSRAVGIFFNSHGLRFWGALLFGFLGLILFNIWGAKQIKMTKRKQKLIIFFTILGLGLFSIGALLNNESIKGTGLIIFALISLLTLLVLLKHVLTHSPYLKAQQKVKIITIGFSLMVLFEMIGVYFMQLEQWILATTTFTIRDISWLIVTIGIIFPKKIQTIMSKNYLKINKNNKIEKIITP